MFLVNSAVIVAGLVLVAQQVNAHCSCSCSGGGTEIIGGGTWLTSPPCGLGPGVDMCNGAKNLPNWGGIGGTLTGGVNGIVGLETAGGIFGGRGDNSNAPIVVRPQEVPKPPVALPVSLIPVAGPCVCKKAIVKPAVLPKPVCKAAPQLIGGGIGVFGSKTITNNFHHSSSVVGTSGGIVGGVGTVVGGTAAGGPIVVEKDIVFSNNEANLAPADAVSLSLAYNTAQQSFKIPVEDRLTFGFRKIPEEVPQQVVFKKNIPEEQIFNLNGQIVELKPVKIASQQTVEEEAHEDLLDLQEEETNAEVNYGTGLRRISLGEIGYGPAKISKKTFVDVPSGAVGEAVHGVSQVVNNVLSGGVGSIGGALGGTGGSIGSAAGSAAGALGSAASGLLGAAAGAVGSLLGKSKDGYVPGNVVYKTVPKLSQVLTPLPEVPPDETECESEEAKEQQQSVSYNDFGASSGLVATGVSCGMCCKPCCTAHHFHATSASALSSLSSLSSSSLNAEGNLSPCGKKASVLVQRL